MNNKTIVVTKKKDVVFSCTHCSKSIIRDSREHDDCIVNEYDLWFCGDCHQYAEEDDALSEKC